MLIQFVKSACKPFKSTFLRFSVFPVSKSQTLKIIGDSLSGGENCIIRIINFIENRQPELFNATKRLNGCREN